MVEQIDKGVEIKDELGEVSVIQMLEERENDIIAYEKAVENAKKDLANYVEQLEVDREIWDILEKPGSTRTLNPTKEFEKNERFQELMHMKQLFQIRSDRHQTEQQVKYLEQQVEGNKQRLSDAKEALTKLKKDNLDLLARMKRNKEE